MISALGFGSIAALSWAVSVMLSAPVSRMADPVAGFGSTTAAGAAIALPAAALLGSPAGIGGDWILVATAGIAYAAGTVFLLLVIRRGHVSVVVPIIATDGAIAALLAIIAGASLSFPVGVGMVWIVVGILLVTAGAAGREEVLAFTTDRSRPLNQTVVMALAVAVSFGLVFFVSAEATTVPALWVVAGARCAQLVLAGGAVVVARPNKPPRSIWRYVAGYGFFDVAGYAAFVVAAGFNAPVAAVAASQYAALAVVGGLVVYGEHLSGRQALGIAVLILATGSVAWFA